MTRRRSRRTGFTLVELLIVIAIITVLIAIGLPVMSRAREKARQATCMANLHSIAMALRLYRMEEGGYPGPYDPVTGWGGVNALYPTYLDNRKSLICPDDDIDGGEKYRTQPDFRCADYDARTSPKATLLDRALQMYTPAEAAINPDTGLPYPGCNWKDPNYFAEHYSSYNKYYNWIGYVWWDTKLRPASEDQRYWNQILLTLDGVKQQVAYGDNLAFWYEGYRWDPMGLLGLSRPYVDAMGYHLGNDIWYFVDQKLPYYLAQQVYWSGAWTTNFDLADLTRLADSLQRPLWDTPDPTDAGAAPFGLPSAVFPGLINRNAPETTIVTRCPHHRAYTRKVSGPKKPPTPPEPTRGRRGSRGGGVTVTYEKLLFGADIALRLDGTALMIAGPPNYEYDWARQPRLTQ